MIHTDMDGDEDDFNYLINDDLHKKCISAAKDIPNKSYNSEVELVSESTNTDEQTNQLVSQTFLTIQSN